MQTIDRRLVIAPIARIWSLAVAVENWPVLLPHYRWVRRVEGVAGGDGVVEMAAWRPFGLARWPTWWHSRMQVDQAKHEIRYQHIAGITRGMDVIWRVEAVAEWRTQVTIVHTWDGPRWPVIGPAAARLVIGPVFVHGIASRTLAGLARAAEAS